MKKSLICPNCKKPIGLQENAQSCPKCNYLMTKSEVEAGVKRTRILALMSIVCIIIFFITLFFRS